MTLKSIIDPKKKKKVLDALRKGDASLLRKKPLAEKPTAQKKPSLKGKEELNNELHQAALDGDIQKINELLDKGAVVDARSCSDQTPLMYASLNGHKQVVKLLIQKGAEVNAADDEGATPLMYASHHGNQTVKLLIQNGANVKARTKDDRTALTIALYRGKTQTAELLRKHGATE
jgi:ankyrin repeat protein